MLQEEQKMPPEDFLDILAQLSQQGPLGGLLALPGLEDEDTIDEVDTISSCVTTEDTLVAQARRNLCPYFVSDCHPAHNLSSRHTFCHGTIAVPDGAGHRGQFFADGHRNRPLAGRHV